MYPEHLKNLLSVTDAASKWDIPEITIRTACRASEQHHTLLTGAVRKIGDSWILLPEGMYRWKGNPKTESNELYSTAAEFEEMEIAFKLCKMGKIDAEEALSWIAKALVCLKKSK